MDWKTGVWRRSPGKKILREVTIADDLAPIRAFDTLMRDNPESVYGDLLPVLRESDLRMVNLEYPLIDKEAPVLKSGTVLNGIKGSCQSHHRPHSRTLRGCHPGQQSCVRPWPPTP